MAIWKSFRPFSDISLTLSRMTAITDSTIGNNIIVVDVFVIHMLSMAQTNMKPPMSRFPSVPVLSRMASAMRRCRFQRSSASAIRKPPRNR